MLEKRRANRKRVATCVSVIVMMVALGVAGTGPATAVEFEAGELRGNVDTTVSAGFSMRVEDRDCRMIWVNNGGCQTTDGFTNFDDGDLNYDVWDVFANTYKATVDVELAWRNYGGFFRGSVFYDLATMATDTARTDLAREALYTSSAIRSGVVGMGYQLLDAYVYGNWEVAGRPVEIRAGNMLLNWGESLFFQGVNVTNAVDLNRLRAPGSLVREALLPSPMVRVSAEIFRNFSIEAYYQAYWHRVELDPTGSYFSINDLTGRGAEGFFFDQDPGSTGMDPEEMFTTSLSGEQLAAFGFPTEPVVTVLEPPTGLDPTFDAILTGLNSQGVFPSTITFLDAFFPMGMPQLSDRDARKQGQWGVALRYFADAIRTEFGAYYIRFHSKQPSLGFVADPSDLTATTFFIPESFGSFLPIYAALAPETLPPNALDVTVATAPVPVGYFREYPEDINIFGVSAATEIWGIAWGAELSYTTQLPLAVTTAFPEALEQATVTGQRATVSGFVREERLQGHLSAIATIGPGDPYVGALVRALHISSIALTGEVVFVEFPNFDESLGYATVNNTGRPTEFSWAYATLIQGDYDNPFGVPITVTPRVSFSHAPTGTYPGGQTQFIEDTMSFATGVNVDYLGVWQFDLSYVNYFGGGERNPVIDRDFVSFSITRSF
jgi:hypothetical protein